MAYDTEKLIERDQELESAIERECMPEQTDVQGLMGLYYECYGEELPKQYKDYANKDYISEAWGVLTCSVIKTLDDIGWKSMSSQDRRGLFEVIAAYANSDENYYKENYYNIVYAVLYQLVWAACKRLRSDSARSYIDDIISETLISVASNTTQIARYDPTYSPITYLDRLARTTSSEVYYRITGVEKRKSTIRYDTEVIEKIKQSDNVNENIAGAIGFHQLYMEIKRSQNPPAHTEIDAFLNAITNKTQDYKDGVSGSNDEDAQSIAIATDAEYDNDNEMMRIVKAALDRRYNNRSQEYLDAFLWYTQGLEADKQFAKHNKENEKYQMAMDVIKLLSNNHSMKQIGRRNGHIVGNDTKLAMKDNHIPGEVLHDIMNSEMDTYIEK